MKHSILLALALCSLGLALVGCPTDPGTASSTGNDGTTAGLTDTATK